MSDLVTPDIKIEKTVLRATEPKLHQIPVHHYNSTADGPVYTMVPGYQESIKHPNKVNLYTTLAKNGLNVVAYDYSGYRPNHKWRDPVTFESWLEDTNDVMTEFSNGAENVLVSFSFGSHIAVKAANAQTKGLILVIPTIDSMAKTVQRKMLESEEALESLRKKRYYFSKAANRPNAPSVKITAEFLESACKDKYRMERIIAEAEHRPPVRIIVNEFDMFSLHSGALKLQETFEKHGFQAETCIVSTANKHFLFPETIAAVTDAAKEFHHERDFV